VFEKTESDLLFAIALAEVAGLGIAKPAVLHFIAMAMIPVVLRRNHATSRVQRAHVKTRFAERLHGGTAARTCSHYNDVVNPAGHGEFPLRLRWRKVFVLAVVYVRAILDLIVVSLQIRIIEFKLSNL
jgi:hypothetical protein